MRGGRNKFGPLYRRDRQMKQQKANSAPCRIKVETTQTHLPSTMNDLYLMSSPTSSSLSSDVFHQSSVYPSKIGHSGAPLPVECSMNEDRVLPPPSLAYSGLYHSTIPGLVQDKGEVPICNSLAPVNYPLRPNPHNSFSSKSTSASSPSTSLTTIILQTPIKTPDTSSSASHTTTFLSQLLEGEQDESQLCTKVLASLQKEQASRGKHDRLNTFSIMCKMADQTLFGLVEWARNSAFFKELKVNNNENMGPSITLNVCSSLQLHQVNGLCFPQVEDQMVLLQSCWSELLVLDHLCRQVIYGKEGCIYLVTGQQVNDCHYIEHT